MGSTSKRTARTGSHDLDRLVSKLRAAGLRVTLATVRRWTPEQQSEAAKYAAAIVRAEGPRPAFLHPPLVCVQGDAAANESAQDGERPAGESTRDDAPFIVWDDTGGAAWLEEITEPVERPEEQIRLCIQPTPETAAASMRLGRRAAGLLVHELRAHFKGLEPTPLGVDPLSVGVDPYLSAIGFPAFDSEVTHYGSDQLRRLPTDSVVLYGLVGHGHTHPLAAMVAGVAGELDTFFSAHVDELTKDASSVMWSLINRARAAEEMVRRYVAAVGPQGSV